MVKETRFGGQGKIKNKVMCYINIASEIPVQATGFDGRGTIYVHSRKLDETVSSTNPGLVFAGSGFIHNKKEIFILE